MPTPTAAGGAWLRRWGSRVALLVALSCHAIVKAQDEGHATTTTEVPGGHGSFKVNATSSTHENEGQEREEAAGDEVFYNVMASIATITVLIFLSIVFEMGAEWLRESTEEINMPFVNTIFNELTTLGFIGSILFLMSKSGYLGQISQALFGHDKNMELQETIEMLHMALFLFVIIFLLLCIVLLQFGIQVQSELREFERRAPYVQVVVADYCLSTEPATSWWDKLNWRRWQEIAKSKREMVYVSLRRRFVDYHSNHPDPAKAKELAKDFQLEKDTRFPFNEYLTIISGEVMARLIQIDAITWVALEICIVALICLCWWVGPDNEVFVLLGGGAVLIGLNQIVYRRISTMRTLLTPPLLFKKAERYRTKPAWRAQHGLPLLPSSPLMSDEKEKLATDNTPPYLLNLPLGGVDLTSQELADRQKALLGGGNGVLLALFSTRLVFLFTALHLSVFVMRTSGQLIRRDDLHAVEKAVIFVLLALPSLIVASVSTMIARDGLYCFNVEAMKVPRVINKVMRILKARQTLRTLRFVAEMKVYLREHHATEGKAASMKNPPTSPDPADDLRRRSLSFNDTATLPTHHRPSQLLHGATSSPGTGDKLSLLSPRSRSNVEEPMSPMSEPSSRSKAPGRRAKYDEETERREINSIFSLFDRDQSGAITRDEMESLLHVISPDMTESQISRIIVVLDEHHTGEVTFDEFYRWCRSHIHNHSSKHSKHHLIREVFKMIDTDGSGFITVEVRLLFIHCIVDSESCDQHKQRAGICRDFQSPRPVARPRRRARTRLPNRPQQRRQD
ncbi:hypothetical protein, variant 1 [Aphanomyces astaci]|uniref:Calmodulin n=1 Tax=Aphanomyces astaci TaxID=112090 RepID=W4GB42_APHAT|nr:hypothetical protein, variant 1 [Aphanomyces astaci]ETV76279.1 hypothetical protein, variant 1 [Aphanomyces astaci]|eukprot:XP_009834406.1 hypothetical protein, variant 1 [Aphanomyces astaci]